MNHCDRSRARSDEQAGVAVVLEFLQIQVSKTLE